LSIPALFFSVYASISVTFAARSRPLSEMTVIFDHKRDEIEYFWRVVVNESG